MSSPIPSPFEVYNQLPYQFPLFEQPPPVVRISVAGPAPYNTLAVVRTIAYVSSYRYSNGKLQRRRVTMGTNLVLTGYDPLRPEQQHVQHSSTATLRMMQIGAEVGIFTDDNTDFTWAVDAVQDDSWIDETGRWYVTLDTADSATQVYAGATIQVSSWLLCWEPPRQRPAPPPAQVRPWRWSIPDGLQAALDPASVGLAAPRSTEDAGKVDVRPRRRLKRTENP